MTGEARGNLRYGVRTTTALATIGLVAGGYLAVACTAASAQDGKGDRLISSAGTSSNTAGKEGRLPAPAATNSTAVNTAAGNKEGKLAAPAPAPAPAAIVEKAPKEGKLIQAGASNEPAAKGAKLNPAAPADEQYAESFGEQKTADQSADPGVDSSLRTSSNLGNKGDLFRPGPQYDKNYEAATNVDVYGAKKNVSTARPLIEAGREQYTAGEYNPESSLFGGNNLLIPGLAIYGDWRTAVAYNQNNGNDIAQIATRVNIDVDFKLTGTERIHAFFTPLQDNARFTRCEFAGGGVDNEECILEFDPNPQTLFFEGDIGQIYSGLSGKTAEFDLPVTAGLFPLFLQNGIWANDAILGGAASLTAKNSTLLGIPNYDVTFFTAFDNVDNALIVSDVAANRNNNISNLYGVTAFIDAFEGYVETGYGLIQGVDDNVDGELTHFVTAAYTRRYYNTLSNSTRLFGNFGDGDDDEGFLVISENSLISGLPSTLLPYANFFFGVGNPQPLVNGNNAGLLANVGISFETDALTGFPKLNDTGSNAFGGAVGLQYLFNLDQQIVFEVATVQPYGDVVPGVGVADAQYAASIRYQLPLNKDWLFRADATYQLVDNPDVEDNFGIRAELRRKF